MDQLWLGYDDLSVHCAGVMAILYYRPALDARISASFGRVPRNVRAVVFMADGTMLPSSRDAEQLRRSLAAWRLGRS
ncbi:MAG: hypothetical protein HXY39_12880 [Chloroflexi bacterium]|nr:hypothetical protein [Chloroflexota bacterium]